MGELDHSDHLDRTAGTVWRQAPDRVLVRRVGDVGAHADLFGVAALAWLALEGRMTVGEIAESLRDAELDIDAELIGDACATLVAEGWVQRSRHE